METFLIDGETIRRWEETLDWNSLMKGIDASGKQFIGRWIYLLALLGKGCRNNKAAAAGGTTTTLTCSSGEKGDSGNSS